MPPHQLGHWPRPPGAAALGSRPEHHRRGAARGADRRAGEPRRPTTARRASDSRRAVARVRRRPHRTEGVGPAAAARVLACLEMSRRAASWRSAARPSINTPEDVVDLCAAQLRGLGPRALLGARAQHQEPAAQSLEVSVGSLNASIVHPRELFKEAVKASAASVVVVHNHPSGDPTPVGRGHPAHATAGEGGRRARNRGARPRGHRGRRRAREPARPRSDVSRRLGGASASGAREPIAPALWCATATCSRLGRLHRVFGSTGLSADGPGSVLACGPRERAESRETSTCRQ